MPQPLGESSLVRCSLPVSRKIFISYRRDDAAGYAGRIYDRLNARFPNSVFMDVSGIEPGMDFIQTIEEAVGACDTLIVLMGRQWLAGRGPGEGRLDDPNDFVRLEIATALKRNIRVLPVLLRGAVMPTAQQLPPDIALLARRHALGITDEDFDHDIQRLVEIIEPSARGVSRPGIDRGTSRKFARSAMAAGLLLAAAAVTFWSFNRETQPIAKPKPTPQGVPQEPSPLSTRPMADSLISPPSLPSVSSPAAKKPTEQPRPPQGGSPQGAVSGQATRVAGVVAELTRFVRTSNLITAEVTLRNTGSLPAKFSCSGWQLIDEQTGLGWEPDIVGGQISPYNPATLEPGKTHVTWAKFKAKLDDLSAGKYSLNVESILNRPFEGLTLTDAAPQPTQQATRVAGVVAELTRFVRTSNLITAEVTLRNTGSLPAKFSCSGWQLIDEQTGLGWEPDIVGGQISPYNPATLEPGKTHVTWAKFKAKLDDLSAGKYSLNVESILNRPFEGLALKSQ